MARDFDGTGDYILNDSGLTGIDVPQRSVSFIVNVNAIPTWKAILNINADDTNNRCSLSAISPVTSGWALELEVYTDGADGVWKTGDLSLNVEYSICVIYDGLNEPVVYVDGVDQGALTVVTAPTGTQDTGVNSIVMGANIARTNSLDGQLSEVAIWSRILTDNEAILITDGNSPNFVPDGLQHYWPLIDWSYDQIKTSGHGAETGTTVTTHPSINYRYPVIASAVETTGTTNSGSPYNMVVNMPSNRPDSALYVFHITRNSDDDILDPAGIEPFVDIYGVDTVGSLSPYGSVAYYMGFRMGNTEPASYTFTSNAVGGGNQVFGARVLRIEGVDESTQYGNVVQNESQNSSPAIANPLNITSPDSLILRLYSVDTRIVDNVDSRDSEMYSGSSGTYPTSVGYGCGISQGPGEGIIGSRYADLNSVDDWEAMTIEIRSDSAVFPPSPPWNNFEIVKLAQPAKYVSLTGTSINATLDEPVTPGNFLVTTLHGDKDVGTITKPTGFSEDTPVNNTSVSMAMAYKQADGSEGAITWGTSTSRIIGMWLAEFSGIDSFLDLKSADSGDRNVQTISVAPTEISIDIPEKTAMFVAHALDSIPGGGKDLKTYPEMTAIFDNADEAINPGHLVFFREDHAARNWSSIVNYTEPGGSYFDQAVLKQLKFKVQDPADPAEKFESIYVPPKLLSPQSAVPRALPAGQLAIDWTNPYAKYLVAAYVFEGCQAVEVVQNLRPTDNSCSLTGGGLHQTGTEWVRFLPPDRQFPHNDNWFPNAFGSMVFTYRNTGSENINARLIDTKYTGFTIERDTDTSLRFRLGADWQTLSGFPNLFNGDEYTIWAEWDESNNSRWIHVIGDDGNVWSTSNFGVWSVGSTTDEISFLNSGAGTLPSEGVIRYCLIFDKWDVGAHERTALFQDPYQFIVSKGVAY